MVSIIRYLLVLNQSLLTQINYLLKFIASNINLHKDEELPNYPYRKLVVDKPPIIKEVKLLNYKELLKEHQMATGKEIKPVALRKKSSVPKDAVCNRCGAPHQYLYDNNGGRGQLLCKVCKNTFDKDAKKFKVSHILCPYCGRHLDLKHSRSTFNVHDCRNKQCSFRLNAYAKLTDSEKEDCMLHPEKYKLRYTYREFKIDFFKMDIYSLPKNAHTLQFRKFSPHVMGLCLTYLVNCNLSTRVTARVLREVHGVSISHAHVANMARTAAVIVKPFVDSFDYEPSSSLVADETYIKMKGKRYYIWFVLDSVKKSILGYKISFKRDLEPCMVALRMAFDKFKPFIKDKIQLVADGYSVYNLAHLLFTMNQMPFKLVQVIGLTNDDPVSTEFRFLKQIVERFNRTYKASYRITLGFKSEEGSDVHLALFVAFYNFLRPHSAFTDYKPLNIIPEVEKAPNMPAKWQILIKLAQQQILESQLHS